MLSKTLFIVFPFLKDKKQHKKAHFFVSHQFTLFLSLCFDKKIERKKIMEINK
jgi:hypothetical protein